MARSRNTPDLLKPGGSVEVDAAGCWLWKGALFNTGYGRLRLAGKDRIAHRAAFEVAQGLEVGALAREQFVCHRCDVKNCVNPDHLFLGDAQANMQDRDAKGRQAKGARSGAYTKPERTRKHGADNGAAKLTDADVVEIRRLRAAGASPQTIADRFGVRRWQVWMIVTRRSWRNVP